MAKKASNDMHKAARIVRDLEMLASGDPKKIMRQGKEQTDRQAARKAEDLAASLLSSIRKFL